MVQIASVILRATCTVYGHNSLANPINDLCHNRHVDVCMYVLYLAMGLVRVRFLETKLFKIYEVI